MYYYFSCGYPAAIKFNGIYYGIITDTVKRLRIDQDFSPFVEVCPLNGNVGQLSFILDDKFLSSPPSVASVTDLKGGYLIKFTAPVSSCDFCIIKQQKHPDAVFTLFNENGIKLSIETPNDFYAETFSVKTTTAEFKRFYLGNAEFLAVFLSDVNLLSVYNVKGKITKVFNRSVSNFDTEKGFTTVEKYKDMAKHVVTSSWEEKDGYLKEQTKTVEHSTTFNRDNIATSLIPYAFLEEFLVGGDFQYFTGGSIKEHADKLSGFLGNFIGVFPPPEFISPEYVGLIYKKAENLYYIEYFSFEINNGKICGIKQVDL